MTPPDATALFAEVRALLYAARDATVRRFRIVRTEGSREVSREVDRDSLPAILAVGFRVRSVDKRTLMRRFTLADRDRLPISETPSRISVSPTPSTRLIGVKDEAARSSYEIEGAA